jgi:CubicO group peptidase (beta-lactamase class C family)
LALLNESSACGAFQEQEALPTALEREAQNVISDQLPAVYIGFQDGEDNFLEAAAGKRKLGEDLPASAKDLIHIGSCTKAMTAVLIARLVEQGILRWEQTISESFPDDTTKIHRDHHDTTLLALLQHRGRVPANARNWWMKKGETIADSRHAVMLDSLTQPAQKVSDDGYQYSNLGYMIAGHMAEQATGQSWESLIGTHVFTPLGMESAAFGPTGNVNDTNQAWGHMLLPNKRLLPVQRDNAPALGPAGTVHLSLADWGRFASLFFKDSQQKILTPESLAVLLKPASANGYSLGWMVLKRQWSSGPVLTHSGSNTYWYATLWIAPERNQAYIVATNSGSESARKALDTLAGRVIALGQQQSDIRREQGND